MDSSSVYKQAEDQPAEVFINQLLDNLAVDDNVHQYPQTYQQPKPPNGQTMFTAQADYQKQYSNYIEDASQPQDHNANDDINFSIDNQNVSFPRLSLGNPDSVADYSTLLDYLTDQNCDVNTLLQPRAVAPSCTSTLMTPVNSPFNEAFDATASADIYTRPHEPKNQSFMNSPNQTCSSTCSFLLNSASIPYSSDLDLMESDKQKEKIAAGCRVLRSNSTTSEGVETVPLNKQNGRNNTPTLAEDDIENDELTVERKLQIIHEDKTMDTPNNDYLLKQLPMDMIGTGELHRKIKNLPKKRKLDEAASMGVMAINVELPEQVKEKRINFAKDPFHKLATDPQNKAANKDGDEKASPQQKANQFALTASPKNRRTVRVSAVKKRRVQKPRKVAIKKVSPAKESAPTEENQPQTPSEKTPDDDITASPKEDVYPVDIISSSNIANNLAMDESALMVDKSLASERGVPKQAVASPPMPEEPNDEPMAAPATEVMSPPAAGSPNVAGQQEAVDVVGLEFPVQMSPVSLFPRGSPQGRKSVYENDIKSVESTSLILDMDTRENIVSAKAKTPLSEAVVLAPQTTGIAMTGQPQTTSQYFSTFSEMVPSVQAVCSAADSYSMSPCSAVPSTGPQQCRSSPAGVGFQPYVTSTLPPEQMYNSPTSNCPPCNSDLTKITKCLPPYKTIPNILDQFAQNNSYLPLGREICFDINFPPNMKPKIVNINREGMRLAFVNNVDACGRNIGTDVTSMPMIVQQRPPQEETVSSSEYDIQSDSYDNMMSCISCAKKTIQLKMKTGASIPNVLETFLKYDYKIAPLFFHVIQEVLPLEEFATVRSRMSATSDPFLLFDTTDHERVIATPCFTINPHPSREYFFAVYSQGIFPHLCMKVGKALLRISELHHVKNGIKILPRFKMPDTPNLIRVLVYSFSNDLFFEFPQNEFWTEQNVSMCLRQSTPQEFRYVFATLAAMQDVKIHGDYVIQLVYLNRSLSEKQPGVLDRTKPREARLLHYDTNESTRFMPMKKRSEMTNAYVYSMIKKLKK